MKLILSSICLVFLLFHCVVSVTNYSFECELKRKDSQIDDGIAVFTYQHEKNQLNWKIYSTNNNNNNEFTVYRLVHDDYKILQNTTNNNFTIIDLDSNYGYLNKTNQYIIIPDLFKEKYTLQKVTIINQQSTSLINNELFSTFTENNNEIIESTGKLINTCGSASPVVAFKMDNWKMWVVLVLVISMLILLIFDLYKPYFIIFLVLLIMVLLNIITLKEALAGFSNDGVLTIGFLFPVVYPLSTNPLMVKLAKILFGVPRFSPRLSYLRIFLPIAFLSMFLNNAPIVVTFIPLIKDWTREHNLPASKFLIPLSFMTIAGGLCTIIGTSTNLVTSGLLISYGYEGFSLFEFGKIGGILLVVMTLYLMTIGYSLLPSNKGGLFKFAMERSEKFLTQLDIVDKKSPLIGKTKRKAMEHLDLLKLEMIEVIRPKGLEGEKEMIMEIDNNQDEYERICPVPDDFIIHFGDKLILKGSPSEVMKLHSISGSADKVKSISIYQMLGTENLQQKRNSLDYAPNNNNLDSSPSSTNLKEEEENNDKLTLRRDVNEIELEDTEESHPAPIPKSELLRKSLEFNNNQRVVDLDKNNEDNDPEFFEIVISNSNSCIGGTYDKFEKKYQAVILAVRHRESVMKETTDTEDFKQLTVNMGDTLLVLGKSDFYERWRETSEFYVISRCGVNPKKDHRKFIVKVFGKEYNLWWWEHLILLVFIGMIAAATSGIPMIICSMTAFSVMVILKLISPVKAVSTVDWQLLMMVAAGLGIGVAIKNSGIAEGFAALLSVLNIPDFLLPAVMYLLTQTMTQVITNNAAVACTLPLAVSLAEARELNVKMMGMICAISASSEFVL
ncbi:hypothetical protein ABK040_013697 [Willaertia magna]